jgi:hypothetical protein
MKKKKKVWKGQAWWCVLVIPALGRLRQEDRDVRYYNLFFAYLGISFITNNSRAELGVGQIFFGTVCPGIMALTRYIASKTGSHLGHI